MNTPDLMFYLNEDLIKSQFLLGTTLLDFIRYEKNLFGTKIGCREGDCGACTVLLGELVNYKVVYKTINSCLTPLGNVLGKHVVTIEGISPKTIEDLTLVQKAFVDEQGTQCGFCTTGFIISLTGFSLLEKKDNTNIVESIDGNICRCTGYKSIVRACDTINMELNKLNNSESFLDKLIDSNIVPRYFKDMNVKLRTLFENINTQQQDFQKQIHIGGGTDLYVQKPDELLESDMNYLFFNNTLNQIEETIDSLIIGSGVTFTDFFNISYLINKISNFNEFKRLIASTPIRNLATLGGNVVNASPIGDLTIILLALDSKIKIINNEDFNDLYLKEFFLDYKKIALEEGDIIESFIIEKNSFTHFNFEKVSKRTYLDIATVNTAISIKLTENNIIEKFNLSGGGLAPVPKYFTKASEYLKGKDLNQDNVKQTLTIALTEISPISDIRGSKEYKLVLFEKLFFAHFLTLFPSIFSMEVINS